MTDLTELNITGTINDICMGQFTSHSHTERILHLQGHLACVFFLPGGRQKWSINALYPLLLFHLPSTV